MCLTTLVHVAESEIDNEGRFNSGKIWMHIYPIYIHVPDGIKKVFILCNKWFIKSITQSKCENS